MSGSTTATAAAAPRRHDLSTPSPQALDPGRLSMDPFAARLGRDGKVSPEGRGGIRRLSEVAFLFDDVEQVVAIGQELDPVIYSTSTAPVPEAEGHVGFNLTRIEPGCVGGEFYMTHGHIHVRPDGETYIGQSGRGGIVLSRNGEIKWLEIPAGVVGYIPPGWTHRSVNTGTTPFIFTSVYPALSGQNYEPVRRYGLGARVFSTGNGGYRVVNSQGSVLTEVS